MERESPCLERSGALSPCYTLMHLTGAARHLAITGTVSRIHPVPVPGRVVHEWLSRMMAVHVRYVDVVVAHAHHQL